MEIELALVETVAVSLAILFLGYFLNDRISLLKSNNIPEPVVGGVAFAIGSALLYTQAGVSFDFDMTLKSPMMLVFFTTVGLGASLKLLTQGGPKVLLFLGVATLYLLLQNAVGVMLALATDMNPLFGLLAGSVTLSGGHGTGATYAEMFTDSQNVQGAMELAMACATFGLVLGGLLGGPVTQRLISKNGLSGPPQIGRSTDITYNPDDADLVTPKKMMATLLILALCIIAGTVVYEWLKARGIPLPSFICPLLCGIVVTNVCEATGVYKVNTECVDLWGTMALSMFLAMALMSLRLWELVNLAGPMMLVLAVQAVVLALFTTFVTFRVMGSDYDAAIIAGGHCGFGLGATPTAVANMEALVSRYGASPQAFLVVPMVGAFFIDISNTLVLQLYLSLPFVN